MDNRFLRNEMLFGKNSTDKLNGKNVAVFGVGGVGGYVAEALARSGIGNITVVDNDTVDITNINRQILALESTVGLEKVDVAEKRLKDINPNCNVKKIRLFYLPENADCIDLSTYDYVIDAIDTVSAKLTLIEKAKENNIPIISSMGTGNKINALMFKVADIFDTKNDSLARVMRTECRKRNIKSLKVVYSEEEPKIALNDENNKRIPASNAFVPPVAGFIIAGEVIKDLLCIS